MKLRIIPIIAVLLFLPLILKASSLGESVSVEASELTLQENIDTPSVPNKARKAIVNHIHNIYQSLIKHGLKAELDRNDEVVVVTLLCSDLFGPNSTALKESGLKYLRPFLNFMKYPTMYKLLVAVHSDNTGEPSYSDSLTATRANAIDDFLCNESKMAGVNVVPYGIGQDEPLATNDSMENRALNRRVEIYIVPEWQMIDMAKSGKLK